MEKFRHGTLTVHTQLICILNSTRKISQLSSTIITWSAQVCVSLQHCSDHNYYYYRYYTRTPFATHPRARQVQSGMPGSLSGQAPLYLADDCRLVSDSTRGALCAQLTFPLAWCRQHAAVTATELLQPRDLACGTLFQSSCIILTSPTDCSDDS